MNYSADRFFEKHIKKEGRTLTWLAQKLGYSPTYVRKLSCQMIPITAGFVGRAVTILNEDPSIFRPQDNVLGDKIDSN